MASGGPGDHPLADITLWNLTVYDGETDRLIREIAKLSSRQELEELWEREIGWLATPEIARAKAVLCYETLVDRARRDGWELPDNDA